MIGHYLLTLTPEQEDRVLTGRMRPGAYLVRGSATRCLIGTTCGAFADTAGGPLRWVGSPGTELEFAL